jgi:antitoxin component of MazEF toxin-antitoxin module
VVRVVRIGGNLTITIPRSLARELGIVHRTHVIIERATGRALRLTPLEELHDARGANTARPAREYPRTSPPATREH